MGQHWDQDSNKPYNGPTKAENEAGVAACTVKKNLPRIKDLMSERWSGHHEVTYIKLITNLDSLGYPAYEYARISVCREGQNGKDCVLDTVISVDQTEQARILKYLGEKEEDMFYGILCVVRIKVKDL